MNIAIVEDLQSDKDKLVGFINRYLETSLAETEVECYESGEQFFESADLSQLNVIFLDIYLDGITGVEVAKKIRQINKRCLIVFISASKDFISESYDVKALYYLIKPYEYDMFQKAMRFVNENISSDALFIEIKTKLGQILVHIDDIVYVDIYKHYVQFHLRDEIVKTYSTFAEATETLFKYPNFISCNRSIIVNMKKVSKIDDKDFVLTNGVRVPINRKNFTKIKNVYASYMFEHVYKER